MSSSFDRIIVSVIRRRLEITLILMIITSTRIGSESAGMSDSVVASTCSEESAEKLQNRKISKVFQYFQFASQAKF